MHLSLLTSILNPLGLSSLVTVLLLFLAVLTLVFLASLRRDAANPENIGEATYCLFVQSIGIILMSIGSLPTIYSVLARSPLTSLTYSALLFVFAIGGLIYL